MSRPGRRTEPVLALEIVPAERARRRRPEELAAERPLELRLGWPGSSPATFTVTMRTPGNDFELAVGFLVAEGLLAERDDVGRISLRAVPDDAGATDVVEVVLRRAPLTPPSPRLAPSTSACGLCGTAPGGSMLDTLPTLPPPRVQVREALLVDLPARLQAHQPVFARTGGLHGAALFDADGHLVVAREDIGRHNAVDKVVGALVLGRPPRPDPAILVVSGRAGYEIVQKAAMARIGVVVAVSAPSSLAVEAAHRAGIVLVGFARRGRAVVYAASEQLAPATGSDAAPDGGGSLGLGTVSQRIAARKGPGLPRDPDTGSRVATEEDMA